MLRSWKITRGIDSDADDIEIDTEIDSDADDTEIDTEWLILKVHRAAVHLVVRSEWHWEGKFLGQCQH